MIVIEKSPLSDPEKKMLNDWINSPGRLIYQKCLASQAAEALSEAANILVCNETPELSKLDAEEKIVMARVLTAAKKFLDESQTKDYKWFTVELKPEIPIKN